MRVYWAVRSVAASDGSDALPQYYRKGKFSEMVRTTDSKINHTYVKHEMVRIVRSWKLRV